MRTTIFSISALSCILLFAPLAPAQHVTDPNEFVIENLCSPDLSQEFNEEWNFTGLRSDQVQRTRIELLERGFDPGFEPDQEYTIDAQLSEALEQFQAEAELPVTGQPDVPTLRALSVPVD